MKVTMCILVLLSLSFTGTVFANVVPIANHTHSTSSDYSLFDSMYVGVGVGEIEYLQNTNLSSGYVLSIIGGFGIPESQLTADVDIGLSKHRIHGLNNTQYPDLFNHLNIGLNVRYFLNTSRLRPFFGFFISWNQRSYYFSHQLSRGIVRCQPNYSNRQVCNNDLNYFSSRAFNLGSIIGTEFRLLRKVAIGIETRLHLNIYDLRQSYIHRDYSIALRNFRNSTTVFPKDLSWARHSVYLKVFL